MASDARKIEIGVRQDMAVRRLTPRDTLEHGGMSHADAAKTGPGKVLRELRDSVGEEAFTEWGLGILASFLPAEVLRKAVHGSSLRCPSIEEFRLVDHALSREEARSIGVVRHLRRFFGAGCASHRWEPHEQRTVELGAYLSKLSQPGASVESIVLDLWSTGEGAGILRQALSAVQETRRSFGGEAQSARAGLAVRRLVPEECEFLQGFPRNWTRIPYKKKPADECPDGPRYKALGNSMAVPCMNWLGRKIDKEYRKRHAVDT
jgi:DNA (cytosine-5)-methyltransferase 1